MAAMPRMMLRYDANHDGTLTRAELIAGLKAEFAAHDTHHNGCLDAEQAAAINQERVDADQSVATPVVDWNQDGCIDYTEFSAAPYSLFDQLDLDHDGKLTPKELAARRRQAARIPTPRPPQQQPDSGEHRRRRGGGGEGGPPPDGGRRRNKLVQLLDRGGARPYIGPLRALPCRGPPAGA